jgi:hypothetical protein
LRWTIENTGIRSPIYKIVNSDDTPLYQISKPNPNADFWTMFYFAYAGHQIPPKRVEVSGDAFGGDITTDTRLRILVWENLEERTGKGRWYSNLGDGQDRGGEEGVANAWRGK